MAPQVSKADIIISIHPKHVENIASRVKNHEFRKYLLPAEVRQLWIYETSPASSVKYVATISAGKQPGEIRDPNGLRNDEFDQGRLDGLVKYAYEILKLEVLKTPISLSDLKENGWLNGPPQKYCYVKESMRKALDTVETTLVFDSGNGQPDVAPKRQHSPPEIPEQEPSDRPPKAPARRQTRTFPGVNKRRKTPTTESARQGLSRAGLKSKRE
ncbi:hypothetical protein QBC38DRAFT_486359 [Podospora fimiseda]|uniref:Uncharacterized protein n=1 Tax=Podospora fimiseda TaxID=252190 RepID=A0AAN7BIM8_9PEZI|nr:hypothetical protein QBC38DRAFT_486359 [Podospora fimiseda]